MILTIELEDNEFPLIYNLKPREQINMVLQLIKTGYKIHFPDTDSLKHNIEYQDLINRIDIIKNDIKHEFNNTEITHKLESFEHNLNKLIGLSSNSYKKGNFGECILENLFMSRYGDIQFEKKNHIPHSGDAWLYLPDDKIIMIESKNYTTTVNKDEILKLHNDMINHHIKWAIMISFNSTIQGMKELDFQTFTHQNENYSIIFISNLTSDIHKLDLAIQIIRKLILYYDNINEFPWVIKDINQSLIELNKIMQKNYHLRDHYYSMEKDIHKLLSNYHVILRDYQYDLEKKINEIINTIQNNINVALKSPDQDKFINILEKTYHEKKIYPLLIRLLDFIKSNEWLIKFDDKNSLEFIFYNTKENIGKIKIQQKKITIQIFKFDISTNLNIDKDKENNQIFDILKMII
jgi:hypothetical protein